ncbi:MAG: hypothetical protein H6716_28210 [Polyangiaceae bacterium]|nr:hypothetical protein [Polyangiaceae bacterium]
MPPTPIQLLDPLRVDDHRLHLLRLNDRLFVLGHELAEALGPLGGGDTLREDILGAWTAGDELTCGEDWLLAPRAPFIQHGLAPEGDAVPVVLLSVPRGLEAVFLILLEGAAASSSPTYCDLIGRKEREAHIERIWDALNLKRLHVQASTTRVRVPCL